MITLARKIGNFSLFIRSSLLINSAIAQKTNAQDNELPAVQRETTTTEGELLRSVTFRIPSDAEIEIARTVTFMIPPSE
jgi:hypothetical protein